MTQTYAKVAVTSPDGKSAPSGEPQVSGKTVTLTLEPASPAGQYTVGYHVVSADGHPVSGSYTFTVAEADSPIPSPRWGLGWAGLAGLGWAGLGWAGLGCHVTAPARDRHAHVLTDLGADEVLDYGSTTSARIGPFDVIVDTVGSELNCYRSRLTKGGRMVTVELSAGALAAIAASSVYGARRIRTFSANPDTAVLRDLADHVTSGALRPVVDSVYPLADIATAHQSFERGGVLGKHVVAVSA